MKLIERTRCTGCFACKEICPKSCINIEKDFLGNLYPIIDRTNCIECGMCNRVCPEKNNIFFQNVKQVFAAWSLNETRRKTSASGGVAAEFYRTAVEKDYLICGAIYQEDFHVIHTLTNDETVIVGYQQSKYVYSEIWGIYKKIKQQLMKNKKVLFISLPCKVAGLKTYLGKEYDNLLTVDIVCHGTPSYQLLRDHLLEIHALRKEVRLKFREENEFKFCLRDQNGRMIYCKPGRTDTYLAAFLEGLDYRGSCYRCKYARAERISDITICDFWGLGSEKPFNHPYTGAVSAILINNKRGEDFLKQCQDKFFLEERPILEAIKGNAQLNRPTSLHKLRDIFEKNIAKWVLKRQLNTV